MNDKNINEGSFNPNVSVIRTMVRSAYDMQDLRVQMGNRITVSFKYKLGLKQDGMSEADLEKQEKTLLDKLRLSYNRITDGVVQEHSDPAVKIKLPTERKFHGDELITHYSELLLVDNYIATLRNEEKHFKDMEKVLKKIPIFTDFLTEVRGIGPAMAGIIVSEIDIRKSEYPSSLWKLAGLDVVHIARYTDSNGKEKTLRGEEVDAWYADPKNVDLPILAEGKYPVVFEGVGRSRKEFCLVTRSYINKEGHNATRDSITFNPFLKTKLIGVLGTSFLRAGIATVDGNKMGGLRRLELAKEEGFDPKDYTEVSEEDAVNIYLRARGHTVVVEPSPYAVIYNHYKNRLNNAPRHLEKTPLHKHNMAIRYMVKRFLVDLYTAWRTIEGLPVAAEYSEGVLGKVHGEAKEPGWQHPGRTAAFEGRYAAGDDWRHPRFDSEGDNAPA